MYVIGLFTQLRVSPEEEDYARGPFAPSWDWLSFVVRWSRWVSLHFLFLRICFSEFKPEETRRPYSRILMPLFTFYI